MPLCFTASGFGAREHDAEARHVRERRPHLLAVERPLVAVAHRARREAGDVGPGTGLAEHLAPDLFAGEQRPQVALLLRFRSVHDERRRAHAVADRVAAVRQRRARRLQALAHDAPQLRRQPEAAVAFGEVHPSEPEVELRAEELGRGCRLRVVLGEQLVAQLGDALLVARDEGRHPGSLRPAAAT